MEFDAQTGLNEALEGLYTTLPATIALHIKIDGHRQDDNDSCSRGDAWVIRGLGLASLHQSSA